MGKIIEKIKNLENIKLKTLFIIFLGVWTIDFLTTLYSIEIIKIAYESNPIPALFYNLGWYGWIIFYLIIIILLFILGKITLKFKDILSKTCIKNKEKDKGWIIIIVGIILFFSLELFCIINNLYIIFNF